MTLQFEQLMEKHTPSYVNKNDDQAWISLAQRKAELDAMRTIIDKEEERVVAALKALCNGQSCQGGRFIYEKSYRKGSVRYADIPYLQSIDLEQFRNKDIEIWKLKLT